MLRFHVELLWLSTCAAAVMHKTLYPPTPPLNFAPNANQNQALVRYIQWCTWQMMLCLHITATAPGHNNYTPLPFSILAPNAQGQPRGSQALETTCMRVQARMLRHKQQSKPQTLPSVLCSVYFWRVFSMRLDTCFGLWLVGRVHAAWCPITGRKRL